MHTASTNLVSDYMTTDGSTQTAPTIAVISTKIHEIDPFVDQLAESGITVRGYFNPEALSESLRKKLITAVVVCSEHGEETFVRRIQKQIAPLQNVMLLVYTNNSCKKQGDTSNTVFLKKQNPPQNLVEYLYESGLVIIDKTQPDIYSQPSAPLSESHYQAIIATMDNAIISLDADQSVDFINCPAQKLLGITLENAQEQPVQSILDLRDTLNNQPLLDMILNKSMYQGLSDHTQPNREPGFQAILFSSSGKQYNVSVQAKRYFSLEKGLHEIIVIKDLSNRYSAQQELRARERKYWSLINTTQLGYCILDQRGKLLDANDEFIRVTGYQDLEDIINTPAINWLADHEKQRFITQSKQLQQGGKIIGFEVDFQSINGKITPIEFSASVLKENGETRIVGIGRDISLRRQAEGEKGLIQAQLRQAQKMEAIGQLTGGIAHDFNNVLASILGYTELAQHISSTAEQDPLLNLKTYNEKLESYLNAVHDAGTRAKELVNQLVIFSRNEDTAPDPIKIETTTLEILKLLSSAMPRSLEVSSHFEENLPDIRMTPIQLHQVIMNLCINASDALGEKGAIKISVIKNSNYASHCASCHEGFHGDFVEFQISDNGPGIDKQHIHHIFEPFFTTKEIGQGTGMGLPIVHGILHDLQGHITVSTSPGKGTTIHLLLPACSEQPIRSISSPEPNFAKQINPPPPEVRMPKGHIVVIDDEESLNHLFSDMLTIHGYKVSTYSDSLIAKAELPKFIDTIDLVLTDHTMPGITGSQLAQHLLSYRPDLPIILYTGFSFSMDEKIAKQIGISRFLRKPLDTQVLLEEIEQLTKKGTVI